MQYYNTKHIPTYMSLDIFLDHFVNDHCRYICYIDIDTSQESRVILYL